MSVQLEMSELKELLGKSGVSHSFEVGKCYLIRTVTFFYTGRLISVTDSDLKLEEAAWIADTGRFHDCLKTGKLNEVEPFTHDVIVPRSAIIDATIWTHALPKEQK